MKTRIVQFFAAIATLLVLQYASLAQAPNLGSATSFTLFTATGAVGNTGISQISGNIGTNNGAITGFGPPTTMTGHIDSGNAVTVQCAVDLQAAYDQLFNTAPTSTSHTPTFGSGETLFAGVYAIAAAGSIAGDLTLDAQWNANAVFIFKFGGAFTTGASTTIHLINGASACNVFWGAEGAIAMAAVTVMKGTLIANNGAISMGANGNLEGRLFSTTGAASIYEVSVSLPCSTMPLPINLISFTGKCISENVILEWTTESGINNYFTAERSAEGINWQIVGTVAVPDNSVASRSYTITDKFPAEQTSYYRLKQTDEQGNFRFGKVITVQKCRNNTTPGLIVFPNPSRGKFELVFTGNTDQILSFEMFNSQSQKIYESTGFQSKFDLSSKSPGVYYIQVQLNSKRITVPIVVEK